MVAIGDAGTWFPSGVPVHHVSGGHGSNDGAFDRARSWPVGHPKTDGTENRPAGAGVWFGDPFDQTWNPHHGWRSDLVVHRNFYPVVGGFDQSFCLDSLARNVRIWSHRMGGRLAQGCQ